MVIFYYILFTWSKELNAALTLPANSLILVKWSYDVRKGWSWLRGTVYLHLVEKKTVRRPLCYLFELNNRLLPHEVSFKPGSLSKVTLCFVTEGLNLQPALFSSQLEPLQEAQTMMVSKIQHFHVVKHLFLGKNYHSLRLYSTHN